MLAKKGKRFLALVLTACMVLGLLPASALAAGRDHGWTQEQTTQATQQIEGGAATSYYKYDEGTGQFAPANGSTATNKPSNPDVTISKTIAPTGTENLFDLTLKVDTTQKVAQVSTSPDAAVVLVIDTSGSMEDCANCGHSNSRRYHTYDSSDQKYHCDSNPSLTYQSRMEAAQEAAINFAGQFAASGYENGQKTGARHLSIVAFSGSARQVKIGPEPGRHQPDTRQIWVDTTDYAWTKTAVDGKDSYLASQNDVVTAITGLTANGGTNVSGGLKMADDNLTSLFGQQGEVSHLTRATSFVVLLGDGVPNSRVSAPQGNYSRYTTDRQLDDIWRNDGDNNSEKQDYINAEKWANKLRTDGTKILSAYAGASNTDSGYRWFSIFSNRCELASNAAALVETFEDYIELIRISAEAWKVADPMGPNLTFRGVAAADQGKNFTPPGEDNTLIWTLRNDIPTVTDQNGNEVALEDMRDDQEYTFHYSLTYQVQLDPSGEGATEYQPANGPTRLDYYLTDADGRFVDDNGNEVTGDAALLHLYFNVPKVKGYLGELSFTKAAEQDHGVTLKNAKFTLRNQADTSLNVAEGAVTRAIATGADGKVAFTRANNMALPSGLSYTLTESRAQGADGTPLDIEDGSGNTYDPADTVYGVQVAYGAVTVSPGIEDGIITNPREQTYRDITITKTWRTPESVAGKTLTVGLYQDPGAGFDPTDPADDAFATLTLTDTLAGCSSSNDAVQVTAVAAEDDVWTYTVRAPHNIPNAPGNAVHSYRVAEEASAGFDPAYGSDGLSIINSANDTRSFYAAKEWVLPDSVTGYPDAVSMTVSRDGTALEDAAYTADVPSDGTPHEFTGLPVYNDGCTGLSVYAAAERGLDASLYRQSCAYGAGTADDPYTIVNTVVDTAAAVSGSKTWNDGADPSRGEVTIDLYHADADGTPTGDALASLTLDGVADEPAGANREGADWTFTFTQDSQGGALKKYRFNTDGDGKLTSVTDLAYVAVERGAEDGAGTVVIGSNRYAVSQTGNAITNTLTGTVDVTVNKDWIDLAGAEHGGVTVTLLANGVAVETDAAGADINNPAAFTDGHTFANLPRYDGSGGLIRYTVVEAPVEGYTPEIAYSPADPANTGDYTVDITNRRNIDGDKVSVVVNKTWRQPGAVTAPDVDFTLYADGIAGETKTLADRETTLSFAGLPQYTYTDVMGDKLDPETGEPVTDPETNEPVQVAVDTIVAPIAYTVAEETLTGYTQTAVSGGADLDDSVNFRYDFINTIQDDSLTVTIDKTWRDAVLGGGADHGGARFTLSRTDGAGTKTEVQSGIALSGDTWTSGALDRYDALGRLYTYSVEETGLAAYSTSYDNSGAQPSVTGNYVFAVTNTLDMGYTSHTAVKTWIDGSRTDRPGVTLTLQRSGDGGGSWSDYTDYEGYRYVMPGTETSHTFGAKAGAGLTQTAELPLYDEARTVTYQYRVRETPVAGYDAPVYTDGATATSITNTLTQSTVDVAIQKTWIDPSGTRHPDAVFTLSAVNARGETVTSVGGADLPTGVTLGYGDGATVPSGESTATGNVWTYAFTGLPKYDDNRSAITYTVDEPNPPSGYTRGTVTRDGSLFKVTNTIGQELISVTGSKSWADLVTAPGAVHRSDSVDRILVGLYSGQPESGKLLATQSVAIAGMNAATSFAFHGENGTGADPKLPRYDLTTGEPIRYYVREGSMVDGAFVPVADGGAIVYTTGSGDTDPDTYQVTYDDAAGAITNAYQVPQEYFYRVDLNYTKRVSGQTVVDHSSTGALVSLTEAQTITVKPDDYKTYEGDAYRFVAEGSNTSVEVSEINTVYVITLNFALDLFKLHVNYEFRSGTKPDTGFEDYTGATLYEAGDAYEAAYKAPPAGYRVSRPGNETGSFGDRDVTVTYVYDKNTASEIVPASFTIRKEDGKGSLITSAAATFRIYGDRGMTDLVKTVSTDGGTAAVTVPADLSEGTYYMKEEAAPTGYEGVDTVWTITVSKSTRPDVLVNNVFVTYTNYSVAVADGGRNALDGAVLTVDNALQGGTYTVEYWFETGVNTNQYAQLDAVPALTGQPITYFQTVQASSHYLASIPAGYTLRAEKPAEPERITYATADKTIKIYYDRDMTHTNISATKVWIGQEKTAQVGLFQTVDGVETLVPGSVQTSGYRWSGLDNVTADGKAVAYAAYEVSGSAEAGYAKVADGGTVVIDGTKYLVRYDGGTITNRELRDVTLSKIWIGAAEGEKTAVRLRLLAGTEAVTVNALGAAVGTGGVVTLDGGNNYGVTVPDLFATGPDGSAIAYGAEELDGSAPVADGGTVNLGGVNFTVRYSGATVTNAKQTGSLTVTKSFDGADALDDGFAIEVRNAAGTVSRTLKTTDSGVTGSGGSQAPYAWTVSGLPTADTYVVTETGAGIAHHTLLGTSVTSGSAKVGGTVALINHYRRDTAGLTVTKDVTGDLDKSDFSAGAFTFTIYDKADTSTPVASVKLPTAAGAWTAGASVPTARDYLVVESGGGVAHYVMTVTDGAANDITAGRSQDAVAGGSVTFVNHYGYQPSITTFTGAKVWEDDGNRDGLRPISVRMELYSGETPTGRYADVVGGPFRIEYDSNRCADPTVREVGYTAADGYHPFDGVLTAVPGYEAPAVDGATVYNRRESDTFQAIPVLKTFTGDYGVLPGSVELALYANGEDTGLRLTLTAGDALGESVSQWAGFFRADMSGEDGKPSYVFYKNEGGKPIAYTAVELRIGGSGVTGNASGNWTVTTGVMSAEALEKLDGNDPLRTLVSGLPGVSLATVNNHYTEPYSPPPGGDTSYRVTVRYLEEGTNRVLADEYRTGYIPVGGRYDVTAQTEKSIDGYEIVSVDGESAGALQGNLTITVWYVPSGGGTDIPDTDTPTGDRPELPGGTDIPDGGVPTGDKPEIPGAPGETIIVDGDVPLGDLPQTGTTAKAVEPQWTLGLLALLCSMAAAGLSITFSRKREEDEER